jgi:hypothetical protein
VRRAVSFLCPLALLLVGCEDERGFSTGRTDVFTGELVDADFLVASPEESGILAPGTRMDLTLHMSRLDDDPGTVSTSDGLFETVALVALPAITFDRLSALEIPGGFLRSLVFLAPTAAPELNGADAVLFVSLGQNGRVETRVLAGSGERRRVYGLFHLEREPIDESEE